MMPDRFRKLLMAGVIVSVVWLAGCGSPRPSVPATVKQVPRIRAQELKRMLDAGEDVIVVDTRSRQAYEHGHLPGAVSIPESETEARQGELSREAKIVLYCT
jgi:predicted sulfurtransferase